MISDGSGTGGGNGTACEGSVVIGGGGGSGPTVTVGGGGPATDAVAATAAALFNTTAAASGGPFTNLTSEVTPTLPPYIRTASMLLCILILGIGVIGNVMVPLVILKTKDMRNSTNIFLVNLSVADLMVLLICTPTVLVEVNSKPETWVLGEHMCKAVPFVELTVAHASVLTILAISFERYYAICEPLRAGYVCTKTRAMLICVMAWAFAALFTSPVIMVTDFREERYFDGSLVNVCLMPTEEMWSRSYFILSIVVFFGFPLAILIVLYTVIAYHLMSNPGLVAPNMTSSALRYRRQVVLMLGTVVLSFFVCLLPFRAFTLCIIFASPEFLLSLGFETYQKILYFCRIMLYLNSAINPILYNLMSTKFRDGFRRLLGINEVPLLRKGTVTTTTLTTTTTSSSSRKSSFDHHLLRRSAVVRVVSIGAESNTEDSKNKRSLSKKRPNLTQNGCGNQESYV